MNDSAAVDGRAQVGVAGVLGAADEGSAAQSVGAAAGLPGRRASCPAAPAWVLAMARSSVSRLVVTASTGSIAAPASCADVNARSRATSRTMIASGIRNAIATIEVTAAETSASVLLIGWSLSSSHGHCGGSSITPMPRTVRRYRGRAAVSPSLRRSHETCTSMVWSSP